MRVAILLFALLSWPLTSGGQTPLDSARVELVRTRGFIRAAETQLTKSLELLDRAIAARDSVVVAPPAVVVPPVDTVVVVPPSPEPGQWPGTQGPQIVHAP